LPFLRERFRSRLDPAQGGGNVEEVERKFRLLPGIGPEFFVDQGAMSVRIAQGYLAFDGTEIRVRVSPNYTPKVTLKQGTGLRRKEYEFTVSEAVGTTLLALAEPYVVHKTRYFFHGWEIDFFDAPDLPPIAEWEYSEPCLGVLDTEMLFAWGCVDLCSEGTDDPAFRNANIARRIGATAEARSGYHLRHIPRGLLGELSKVREELEELEDAAAQDNRILASVEASDLYGALRAYSERALQCDMDDLRDMANATKRAFDAGER
jgi:CYTH domain-containing protein